MVLGHPQAAEALIAMQDLVRETVSQDRDTVGPAELTAQIRLYRSAAMAGTTDRCPLRAAEAETQRAGPPPG